MHYDKGDMTKACGLGLAVGVVLGFFAGMATMESLKVSAWKNESVKQGKAEYYLDADNNRQWRWKP